MFKSFTKYPNCGSWLLDRIHWTDDGWPYVGSHRERSHSTPFVVEHGEEANIKRVFFWVSSQNIYEYIGFLKFLIDSFRGY